MNKQLDELAKLTGATLIGDPSYLIAGVEDLESATPSDASFLANPRYLPFLERTKAGVVCIGEETAPIEGKNYLISDSPTATFQKLIELFTKKLLSSGFTGVHPSAVIHETARLGSNVTVGPHAVIDAHCQIGDETVIEACVVLSPGVTCGTACHFYPNVTIREGCRLGNRVILQSGAVIGSCGFGYTTTPQGKHEKQHQLGIVVLEDDVEVGAGTTIDRARFKETRICQGTKIDNLVQIGHNTTIGPHNLIVSQTGISGSVETGPYVVMGGQVGVVGHLKIAGGSRFAARAGIKKSIIKPGDYGGNPAIPLAEHQRDLVQIRNIQKLEKRVKVLESR